MSSISATPIFWVGLDVHKECVTAAVFRNRDAGSACSRWAADQVAATAVARELIGFIWSVLQDIDVSRLSHAQATPEDANAA